MKLLPKNSSGWAGREEVIGGFPVNVTESIDGINANRYFVKTVSS